MSEKFASVLRVTSWSLPPTDTRLITPFPLLTLALRAPGEAAEGALVSVQATARASAGMNHAVFMTGSCGRERKVNESLFSLEHTSTMTGRDDLLVSDPVVTRPARGVHAM